MDQNNFYQPNESYWVDRILEQKANHPFGKISKKFKPLCYFAESTTKLINITFICRKSLYKFNLIGGHPI